MLDEDLVPPQRVRTMQIIAAALITGVTLFLLLVSIQILTSDNRVGAEAPGVLSYAALGLFVANTCMAVMIPGLMVRAGLDRLASLPRSGDPLEDRRLAVDHLLNLRQTSLIVALALLEGAGFMGCMAFLIERNWYVAGTVVAAIVLMVFHFPTRPGVQFWLERQLSRWDEGR